MNLSLDRLVHLLNKKITLYLFMNINEFIDFLTTDDIEYVKDLFTELNTVYKTEMNNFYYSKEQKTTHQIKFIDKDVR